MQPSRAKAIETFRAPRRTGKYLAIAGIALVVVAAGVSWLVLRSMAGSVKDPAASASTVTIDSGLGTRQIADFLHEHGFVSSSLAFQASVLLSGARGELQAGTYELSGAMSARQIVDRLRGGDTKQLTVTIPEGLTLEEIADRIDDAGIVSRKDFLSATRESYDFAFLTGHPEDATLEGFLFPDTYNFDPEVSGRDVVVRMLGHFEEKIRSELAAIESSDLSLFELITLASIVEAEVPTQEDRVIVAGVFYNRLREDMALQADATLAYVTGEDRTDFSIAETQIDDPYNTYRFEGLPPGPINSPSLGAIQAVLHPSETEFFYFVSDPETRETVFAKTLDEHNENVGRVLGR
jgi:UPF0755 protein